MNFYLLLDILQLRVQSGDLSKRTGKAQGKSKLCAPRGGGASTAQQHSYAKRPIQTNSLHSKAQSWQPGCGIPVIAEAPQGVSPFSPPFL